MNVLNEARGKLELLRAAADAFSKYGAEAEKPRAFDFKGKKIFWKIDYYDRNFEFASPDAANPELTNRVLTVMYANEY